MGKIRINNSENLFKSYREIFENEKLTDEEIIIIHNNISQIAQVIEQFVANTNSNEILQLTEHYGQKTMGSSLQ